MFGRIRSVRKISGKCRGEQLIQLSGREYTANDSRFPEVLPSSRCTAIEPISCLETIGESRAVLRNSHLSSRWCRSESEQD
jgi:hypothetical protein